MIVDDENLTTLAQHRFDPSHLPEEGFVLAITAGPDQGQTIALDGSEGRLLLGKGPACEIRLSDPSVSRRHVSLEWVDGALTVRDLGSRNGTWVNGVRIEGARLAGGENLALGGTEIRCEVARHVEPKGLSTRIRFGRLVGASVEMRRLYPLCEKLAAARVSVLVEGETGTGKEVLAEALHEEGPRARGPFLVFDCTSVAPSLVESELFGHERGAFTGADMLRKGIFEEAHGGTLLLDEIGDMPLALQAKLLRVLETGQIRRVGSTRPLTVDVRILSATRRDLDREVQAGRFRDDLFHRLAIARIELPPLRARKGDVGLLARYFVQQLEGEGQALSGETLAKLEAWTWPGNVRELRNAIARYLVLGDLVDIGATESRYEEVDPAGHRPGNDAWAKPLVDQALASGLPFADAKRAIATEFERRFLERVLEKNGNNIARAAAASGIGRRYFQMLRARQRD